MTTLIEVGDQQINVTFKRIKNVHLSVKPPNGDVFVSAPHGMKVSAVRAYALTKLAWINKHQKRMRGQEREPERQYVDMETHYVWGHRYLLAVTEGDGKQGVCIEGSRLRLNVKSNSTRDEKASVYEAWSREQLREVATPMIENWAARMGVSPAELYIQKMKTRWGSCNISKRNIRLNTELSKKPREFLEFVIVHELVHLLERNHTERFYDLMNKFMPTWEDKRRALDELPIGF
jgi:predicted metal-dependent hydrolase